MVLGLSEDRAASGEMQLFSAERTAELLSISTIPHGVRKRVIHSARNIDNAMNLVASVTIRPQMKQAIRQSNRTTPAENARHFLL